MLFVDMEKHEKEMSEKELLYAQSQSLHEKLKAEHEGLVSEKEALERQLESALDEHAKMVLESTAHRAMLESAETHAKPESEKIRKMNMEMDQPANEVACLQSKMGKIEKEKQEIEQDYQLSLKGKSDVFRTGRPCARKWSW